MKTKIKNLDLNCSRREVLRIFSALFTLVPAYSFAGGSFVDSLADTPDTEGTGNAHVDTLAQFMDTIIPGAGALPHATDVFVDPFYQFNDYARFFVKMLNRRSRRNFGGRSFSELNKSERATLIKAILGKHGIYAKLTAGAIFISQIYVYSGLYGESGCALIDYPGRFRTKTVSHSNPESFLPRMLSSEGNPL